ncbi:response regulator transcription factor [Streptomyces sp. NBC_00704]|nr:response regulator transcription factor [Streptomyces sp. NBC_00704]
MQSPAGGTPQAPTRVLVVDGEPQTARALVTGLRARGHEVDIAHDGVTALRLAAARHPDVVLLDPGLPDMDGPEAIRKLRARTGAPILVLSAGHSSDEGDDKGEVDDEGDGEGEAKGDREDEARRVRAEALGAGADDCLTEPFGVDDVLARLRAAVHRAEAADGSEAEVLVETDGFTVDLAARKVYRADKEVRLTPTEWRLLEVLVRNTGRLVGQRQLLQEVWGPSYGTETNYLRVYMAQLRRKLEANPSHPRHFVTEPGTGYRFER